MNKFFTSLETYFFGLLGLITGFFMPIIPFLILSGGLIIMDTITGIIAARKRGEKIRSRPFSRVLDKITVYGCSILACHGVEITLPALIETGVRVTYFAVGAIAFTEVMSIMENTRVVSGADIASVIKNLLPGKRGRETESEENREE